MNAETTEREWSEVLAMAELARAAYRCGVPVVSSGSEAGLRHVSLAAGLWCHVTVSYPSWLAERPSHVSYQVDATRHGEHLGTFLSGVQAEDGVHRIARLLQVVSRERPLLREIAGRAPDPAARARELFGSPETPGLGDDPMGGLAAACGLVRCGSFTEVVPAFALPEWGRSRDTGRAQSVNTLGTYLQGDCDAVIVHTGPNGTVCAPYRDESPGPMDQP